MCADNASLTILLLRQFLVKDPATTVLPTSGMLAVPRSSELVNGDIASALLDTFMGLTRLLPYRPIERYERRRTLPNTLRSFLFKLQRKLVSSSMNLLTYRSLGAVAMQSFGGLLLDMRLADEDRPKGDD